MYGIIDIGSNSMRLSCFKRTEKDLSYVFHKKYMAGLASYVTKKNLLSERGIDKAVEILTDFKKIISSVGIENVSIIATASIRNVNNTEEILEQIKERTGLDVEVLTGKEEALCDFVGATHFTKASEGIVVDIGGGSTELVFFSDSQVEEAVSIPYGSLNMYTKHVTKLFPKKKEIHEIQSLVRKELEHISSWNGNRVILGVGGTSRAVCKLYNDFYDLPITNRKISCDKLSKLLEELKDDKEFCMRKLLQIIPERIHTILPGLLIMDEIIRFYDCKEVEISSWGVREGYLIDRITS